MAKMYANIALASIAFILIGFFALSTAMTLYAVSRLAEKTNKKCGKLRFVKCVGTVQCIRLAIK